MLDHITQRGTVVQLNFKCVQDLLCAHLLFDEDGGALQRNTHHLVRIPRHRVGPKTQTNDNDMCLLLNH